MAFIEPMHRNKPNITFLLPAGCSIPACPRVDLKTCSLFSPPTRRFSLATLVSFSLHLRDSLREAANSLSTLALTLESSLRRVFNWDSCHARDVFNGELVEVLGASLTLLMSLWMSVSLVVTLANPSSSRDHTVVSSAVEAKCLTSFFRAST